MLKPRNGSKRPRTRLTAHSRLCTKSSPIDMTVIFCVVGEDQCEVQNIKAKFPRINTKDRRKMESYREVINSTKGKKGRGNRPRRIYKRSKSQGRRGLFF